MNQRLACVVAASAFLSACQCGIRPCATAECAATFDAFLRAWANNQCSRMIACGYFDPAREADCLAFAGTNSPWADATAGIARGYRTYDRALGQRCLADVLAQRCGRLSIGPYAYISPPCGDVVAPASGSTGHCATTADCSLPGDVCLGSSCGATCIASGSHSSVGTPCSVAVPCVATASWSPAPGCDRVLRTCQVLERGRLGAPCTGDLLLCRSGYVCRALVLTDGGAAGTCAESGPGDPCLNDFDCPTGGLCADGGVCSTGSCDATSNCRAGERCSDAGTCEPALETGAACTAPPLTCVAPALCLPDWTWATLTCQVAIPGGSPCPTAIGDDPPELCVLPFRCAGGRCTHAGARGEDCIGSLCLDGTCDSNRALSGPSACVAKFADGHACASAASCASGSCIEQVCRAPCR